MPLAEAHRGRDRGADDVDELPRPLDRSLAAAPHYATCDLTGVPLLSIPAEDRLELPFVVARQHSGRARLVRGIHAHVERRVGRVREAALGPVDLHRGEAEVEEHRVGLDAVGSELREDDSVVAPQEPSLHATR